METTGAAMEHQWRPPELRRPSDGPTTTQSDADRRGERGGRRERVRRGRERLGETGRDRRGKERETGCGRNLS